MLTSYLRTILLYLLLLACIRLLGKRQIPGSTAFVPGTAGLILAGEVIKDIIKA